MTHLAALAQPDCRLRSPARERCAPLLGAEALRAALSAALCAAAAAAAAPLLCLGAGTGSDSGHRNRFQTRAVVLVEQQFRAVAPPFWGGSILTDKDNNGERSETPYLHTSAGTGPEGGEA